MLLCCLSSPIEAQWSTSTLAQNALYVCPGFYPGIVTFDDGSSIVLGALQSYIFARKLDERGFYLWTPPVQVHHNDSSFITEHEINDWGGWTGDGDGGVILFWYDHRGAYRDSLSGDWMNNAIYAQRVDKFGAVRWTSTGIRLQSPETGLKNGIIASDGNGGFVLAWTERRFDYPGSSNRSYLKLARYDQTGTKLWESSTDSSTVQSTFFLLYRCVRGGQMLHLDYYAGGNFSRVVDVNGTIVMPSPGNVRATIAPERDSVVYVTFYPDILKQYKIGSAGDTVWVSTIQLTEICQQQGWTFVPDGLGGAYMMIQCGDSLLHLDSVGLSRMKLFEGINFGGRAYSDGNHGLVAASSRFAKRFDQAGNMIWPAPVLYLQDPDNSYFRLLSPDNKGGVIAVYWTVLGGVFAQHTGRNGSVGIVTKVDEPNSIAKRFLLKQNYPNPFNAITRIEFSIERAGDVSLTIFDILGREIQNLVNTQLEPGKYKVTFDASSLASGFYIYRLVTSSHTESKRMLLVK